MEIQQSSLYADYIKKLRWTVIRHEGFNIYIKQFPLYGGLAKIQRITKLFDPREFTSFLKKHRIRRIIIEPDKNILQSALNLWTTQLSQYVAINTSPYIPTKTIAVDLTPSEDEIFQKFSEAKRRAVRRAMKNGVFVSESTNVGDLIKIKNKSSGFLGFITTYGIKDLWHIFSPSHASIVLAYSSMKQYHIVGGILLLFWDKTAYYWIAGATKNGKKLFAPTALVWEALKISKKRGCRRFDFVGVWDERIPQGYASWKGFTKFKEGFGGENIYYPIVEPLITAMLHR